jgi:hypothetical protein
LFRLFQSKQPTNQQTTCPNKKFYTSIEPFTYIMRSFLNTQGTFCMPLQIIGLYIAPRLSYFVFLVVFLYVTISLCSFHLCQAVCRNIRTLCTLCMVCNLQTCVFAICRNLETMSHSIYGVHSPCVPAPDDMELIDRLLWKQCFCVWNTPPRHKWLYFEHNWQFYVHMYVIETYILLVK